MNIILRNNKLETGCWRTGGGKGALSEVTAVIHIRSGGGSKCVVVLGSKNVGGKIICCCVSN
jgi:hypothetical protein